MSEHQKTALVLGAGGFIGSHMVRRLRSEGYWVRGVDLKHPEFSKTEAHEFVQGDLRDMNFVERVIQFKGYQGNFYHNVPSRYLQPFDEIYQFAAERRVLMSFLNFETSDIALIDYLVIIAQVS